MLAEETGRPGQHSEGGLSSSTHFHRQVALGVSLEDLDPITSAHTLRLNLAHVSCSLPVRANYLLGKKPLLLFSSLYIKFHIQSSFP